MKVPPLLKKMSFLLYKNVFILKFNKIIHKVNEMVIIQFSILAGMSTQTKIKTLEVIKDE